MDTLDVLADICSSDEMGYVFRLDVRQADAKAQTTTQEDSNR